MISVTKLYGDRGGPGDALRYGDPPSPAAVRREDHGPDSIPPAPAPKSAAERRPVVVWNCTRACNLRCVHCYTDSDARHAEGELDGDEARALFDDLADFGVPAVLVSGGEPLVRRDIFDLAEHARDRGLRLTLSTNGTLIDGDVARRLRRLGFTYVGISLDGIGDVNDRFRGVEGAFDRAMRGFRHCVEVGQRVGLRMTLTRHNARDLDAVFDFIERERIDRACFYHLVYSGRGGRIADADLAPEETRDALDTILRRSRDFFRRGLDKDILTVGNHVDGVYIYLKLRAEEPERAERVARRLRWNGGGLYASGVGIGCVGFTGDVHPDQFWRSRTLGNIRARPFSDIWTDTSDPLMRGLKDRRAAIRGQCRRCRHFPLCGGSMRVRAETVYGDPWAWDPGCYLTASEIGLTASDVASMKASGEWFERPPRPGPADASAKGEARETQRTGEDRRQP